MKKTVCSLLVCMLGQATYATDLVESWQAAKTGDAQFSAARNALRAGQEKANQGTALLLPKVDLTGSANLEDVTFDPKVPYSKYVYSQNQGRIYGYKIALRQPLFRMDVFANASQLRKQTAQAEIQFKVAEQDLILRVAKAYLDVIVANEKMRQTEAEKASVGQQLAQAKKSFEVGVSTITDTDEAQARLDSTLSTEIAAQNDLAVKLQTFELLTGIDAKTLLPFDEKVQPGAPEPNDVAVWLDRAKEGNLNLVNQQLSLDIAKSEIDKYRALTSPSVDLVASHENNWVSPDLTSKTNGLERTQTNVIGIQVSIPLFTGGDRSSRFREAVAKYDQQKDNVEAARRDTVLNARKSFLGVQSGAAQINALQQALVSSKSLVDSTTLGREVGVRTTIDVLNAQTQYYSTRYNLTVAKANYLISRLQLASATGDLAESDLLDINMWLSR